MREWILKNGKIIFTKEWLCERKICSPKHAGCHKNSSEKKYFVNDENVLQKWKLVLFRSNESEDSRIMKDGQNGEHIIES